MKSIVKCTTLCMLILMLCGCSLFGLTSLDEMSIVPKSEQKWYAKEELTEVLLASKDEFEAVAEIVLRNSTLEERLQNSKEGQASIESIPRKIVLPMRRGTALLR